MSEHVLSPPTYFTVCAALVLLTILTVGLSFVPLPPVWHVTIGLIIAVMKASLVVLFFMHAIMSDRVTLSWIAVACFWLGILLVLTLTDYFTRDMITIAPGH